jgi:hypothetical protein
LPAIYKQSFHTAECAKRGAPDCWASIFFHFGDHGISTTHVAVLSLLFFFPWLSPCFICRK